MSTGGVGHQHDYDPRSGWCTRYNLREDGRLLGRGGDIIHHGRGYTEDELAFIRQNLGATA